MIKSMTGFGVKKIEKEFFDITVEVKSLNSKFLDASIRGLPKDFGANEITIRNVLSKQLERGKVVVSIDIVDKSNAQEASIINKDLFRLYYKDVQSLAEELDAPTDDLVSKILSMPRVLETSQELSNKEDVLLALNECLTGAIENCVQHRLDEGQALEVKLLEYISTIGDKLEAVIEHDPNRIARIKERIQNHIQEYLSQENIDESRFEQEMIFYIEKLDITEEKVRLKNHLEYFKQILSLNQANGKKLGFISQEIGREINTIGSKANDADIQKLVVEMKDELEKIKEQVLNVL